MLRCIMDAEMNAVLHTTVPHLPIRRERIGPWRERLWLPNGREVLMRPIEPIDVEPLRRSFARLSPEEVRLRFLHPITEMTSAFARQLCELERSSGFALVVTEPLPAGEALIGAVARLALDSERRDAEFAIIVGREIGGLGLGIFLMKRLIDYARRRRLDVLWGDVREENSAMLAVCDELGFKRSHHPEELGIVRVSKRLRSD
jgi:RimJ/RimL family protein N-acetyltransferase